MKRVPWREVLPWILVLIVGLLYLDLRNSPAAEEDTADQACQGVITPEALQAVIGTEGGSVFACRERHAPTTTGELSLMLRIEPDGHVSEAGVSGMLDELRLHACVIAEAESWQFQPMPSCALANVPFVFGNDPVESGQPPADPACTGTLAADSYEHTTLESDLEACLSTLPAQRETTPANLTIEVGPDGVPTTVTLASTEAEQAFVQCIHQAARAWRFEASDEPCRVAELSFVLDGR